MKITETQIIIAAIDLLQEEGLEGVTFRKLQASLSVKAPALYWRFHNKAELLNAMSEYIIADYIHRLELAPPNNSWQQYATVALGAVREAMLAHTDGARLVASSGIIGVPSLARLIEDGIHLMRTEGISASESSFILFAALHYTFGHVIEEQTASMQGDNEIFFNSHPFICEAVTSKALTRTTPTTIYEAGLKRILG